MAFWIFMLACDLITPIITLFPSILILLPFIHSSYNTIGTVGGILCMIQCSILLISIFPTEIALKRNFTDKGIRLF